MRRRRGAESIAVMASHLEIDRFTVSGRWIGALAALACGCLLAAAPTASAQFVVATNANILNGVLVTPATNPNARPPSCSSRAAASCACEPRRGSVVNAGSGCLQDGATAVCGGMTSIEASGTPLGDELRNTTAVHSLLIGAGRLRLVAPKRPRKALASASYRLRRGGGTTVALRLGGIRARTLVTIAGGLGPTGRPHVTVRRLTNR
jgi:hypothetical protein